MNTSFLTIKDIKPFIDSLDFGLVVVDTDLKIYYANPWFINLFAEDDSDIENVFFRCFPDQMQEIRSLLCNRNIQRSQIYLKYMGRLLTMNYLYNFSKRSKEGKPRTYYFCSCEEISISELVDELKMQISESSNSKLNEYVDYIEKSLEALDSEAPAIFEEKLGKLWDILKTNTRSLMRLADTCQMLHGGEGALFEGYRLSFGDKVASLIEILTPLAEERNLSLIMTEASEKTFLESNIFDAMICVFYLVIIAIELSPPLSELTVSCHIEKDNTLALRIKNPTSLLSSEEVDRLFDPLLEIPEDIDANILKIIRFARLTKVCSELLNGAFTIFKDSEGGINYELKLYLEAEI